MPSEQNPREGVRIIVADDEHHIRAVLAAKLRSAGFEVSEARDGEEALGFALENPPRLIVTDLQMPCMSGLELCERLKADARTSGVRALLITARGHILRDEQIARTNIAAVMSKPFSAREVLARVEGLISSGQSPSEAA